MSLTKTVIVFVWSPSVTGAMSIAGADAKVDAQRPSVALSEGPSGRDCRTTPGVTRRSRTRSGVRNGSRSEVQLLAGRPTANAALRREGAMIHFSRRWLISGSVLVVGGVAVASSAFAGRAASVHPRRSASLSMLAPPTPRIRTLGVTRAASLVSYCWSRPTPGGGGTGVCADGAPGHPAHTLLGVRERR